jgi:hypothetical protein
VERGSLRVQRGSLECSVADWGVAWLSQGAEWLRGCSVAHYGATWLRVQRGPLGCSVAQLGCSVAQLVQFKSRLGTPERFFPLSETREERGLGEWLLMNVLYECDYECMKKTNK